MLVFGSFCYPCLTPYGRTKLQYKSRPCIFTEYSPIHKGHKCFDPTTNKTLVSRHVVFSKSVFLTSLPSASSSSPQFTLCALPKSRATPPTTSQGLESHHYPDLPPLPFSSPPPPLHPTQPSPVAALEPTHPPSTSPSPLRLPPVSALPLPPSPQSPLYDNSGTHYHSPTSSNYPPSTDPIPTHSSSPNPPNHPPLITSISPPSNPSLRTHPMVTRN